MMQDEPGQIAEFDPHWEACNICDNYDRVEGECRKANPQLVVIVREVTRMADHGYVVVCSDYWNERAYDPTP